MPATSHQVLDAPRVRVDAGAVAQRRRLTRTGQGTGDKSPSNAAGRAAGAELGRKQAVPADRPNRGDSKNRHRNDSRKATRQYEKSGLELAREGKLAVTQEGAFTPI